MVQPVFGSFLQSNSSLLIGQTGIPADLCEEEYGRSSHRVIYQYTVILSVGKTLISDIATVTRLF